MRKSYLSFIVLAFLVIQPTFAHGVKDMESKACTKIASACLDAGFSRGDTADKKFWQGCMKAIILGQAVEGVTVDSVTVKTCRANKISALKQELKELQKVSVKQ